MARNPPVGRFLDGRVVLQSKLPEPVNYKSLILRLTAHACRFLNTCYSADSDKVIDGVGLSPEDFAIHVVAMFTVGELPHDGSKGMGGLIRHLTVAMEHDILDALDRAEHKLADFLDPIATAEEGEQGTGKALADFGEEAEDLPQWLDGEAFKTRVYSLVENVPDLKEMAVAIFEVNALKPSEIATVCMTTAADIQNRKKRFGRLLEEYGFRPKEGVKDEE
jgi:hypothetical protein